MRAQNINLNVTILKARRRGRLRQACLAQTQGKAFPFSLLKRLNQTAAVNITHLDRNYKYDKLINEDKPLPVLARGWPHFLYLKTAATLFLDTIIKSTDEGKPLLNLSSIARLTLSRST